MDVILIIIIVLLSAGVVLLALALMYYIKNGTHLTKNEREFIKFSIDMYIQYAEDLEINSKEQHGKITKELEKIKLKHLKDV